MASDMGKDADLTYVATTVTVTPSAPSQQLERYRRVGEIWFSGSSDFGWGWAGVEGRVVMG